MAGSLCRTWTRALWIRAPCLHHLLQGRAASRLRCGSLMKIPDGDRVASELGPGRRHSPTGFFNDEFYVGWKPYSDRSWKMGPILTSPSWPPYSKTSRIPGRHLQPTRSPPRTRWTRLLPDWTSALAVKISGPDLNVLQNMRWPQPRLEQFQDSRS